MTLEGSPMVKGSEVTRGVSEEARHRERVECAVAEVTLCVKQGKAPRLIIVGVNESGGSRGERDNILPGQIVTNCVSEGLTGHRELPP